MYCFMVEWQLDVVFAGTKCNTARKPILEAYDTEAKALGKAIELARMGYVAYVLDTRLPMGEQVIARRSYNGTLPGNT